MTRLSKSPADAGDRRWARIVVRAMSKRKNPKLGLALLASLLFPAALPAEVPADTHWPSFRGRAARGVAEGFATPVQWDVAKGENLKWKTAISGLGHSSVVVWGERLFVTTAVRQGEREELKVGLYGDIKPVNDDSIHQFELHCLDRNDGRVRWSRTVHEGVPRIQRHPKSSHANSTPATDGERVVAFFGSEGLYCYDMEGQLQWKRDFGVLDAGFFMVPSAQWGFASSPVLYDGKVIIQADVQKDSFLAVLDLEDGHDIWRVSRDDVPTWSTPTVYAPAEGTAQIILNGFKHIGGYDLASGHQLWHMQGGGDIPVPRPIVAHDLIFITNAHGRQAPIYAIRPDARGDISLAEGTTANEGIAWSLTRDGGYMPTPIAYGDYLYVLRDNGVLSCFNARTGERLYKERLGGGGSGFSSSPVAADGRIYITNEYGEVYVIQAGPEFEQLAVNELGEIHLSTPAISAGVLFFRTRGHVVAIAELAAGAQQ